MFWCFKFRSLLDSRGWNHFKGLSCSNLRKLIAIFSWLLHSILNLSSIILKRNRAGILGIIRRTWTWIFGLFLDSTKSLVSEEKFLSLKFWGLGIRLLNKTLSFFFFCIFMNFYGVQTVGKLGLLILAFIVFWKWHNLYLNEVFDGIEMKTNHNWYFKKPQKSTKIRKEKIQKFSN